MGQLRRTLIVVLVVAASAACSGGGGSAAGGSNLPTDPGGGSNNGNNGTNRTLSVTVTNNSFTPGATTITHGSTVQWTWNTCTGDGYGSTDACVEHTVTFDDGPTSQMQDRGTFQRTFNTAGTYKYHCAVHGAAMSGEVKVE
ncbi:MAG TPA: plastocyanin/azurin family copper-binding protein [Gemmatimonadaceae bacterium]|nr:plastocyanin/azurin family copper-binding protein [Gemmatimonadaceae bacterium]